MSAMLKITLPDGSVSEVTPGTTPADIAAAIGPGLAKAAPAGRLFRLWAQRAGFMRSRAVIPGLTRNPSKGAALSDGSRIGAAIAACPE